MASTVRGAGHRSSRRAVLAGASASVATALPLFFTGAMAVQLGEDLAFGAAGLGAALAVFRATGAVTASFLGRLTDRLGAVWSLRAAVGSGAIASLGIALFATTWASLVAWMVVASCARTLAGPAANRLVVNNVRPERHGIAFGIKQSAAPLASMLAGVSVPLVALTLGWRWAYALGAGLCVVVLLAIGRRAPSAQRTRRAGAARGPLRDRRTVMVLAGTMALASASGTVVPAFYVISAVEAGTSARFAGTLLAVASLAAIGVRMASGIACDRMASGHLRLCAGVLAAGSLGMALLATGQPVAMAAGAIVALAGTWGFAAAFWFGVVRAYSDTPGRITGALMPGGQIGATASPLLFGVLADGLGFTAAWAFAGTISVLAAGAMLLASRRLAGAPGGAAAVDEPASAPAE